jgi:phosphoesterase RecJ-like protein
MIDWNVINKVLILQPENPDGDSVASALALEEILSDIGKEVIIYSYVHIPNYLRYITGQDRITDEFPKSFDLTVIVDTVTGSLLENTLKSERLAAINKKPVLVLDCHPVENDLPLEHAEFYKGEGDVIATGEIVYQLAQQQGWEINSTAGTRIVESILADTLGMTTEAVNSLTLRIVADMLDAGAKMSDIDTRRREIMSKSPELVQYKGKLLQRIEFLLENQLAWVVVPWEEIEKYSPHYNPSMLALEELRNTSGVKLSVAIKTYPDGKITGKIRASVPLAGELAAHFGGGGHAYASGFKTTEWELDELKQEIIKKTQDLLK